MKIKIKDLTPNLFRAVKTYPIDRAKVEALKMSITETEFWDNLVARPHPKKPGKYQLGYGYHRLVALKELGIEEIDIPVRDLDDATMIRIMASENLDNWKTNPATVVETVSAAKDFLDAKLAKAKSYGTLHKNMKRLVDKHNFDKVRSIGVGEKTLLKFLGGNWKQWMIQRALEIMRDVEEGKLDPKAAQVFPNLGQANQFRRLVREKKLPLQGQFGLAAQLSERWNRPRYSSARTIPKKNKPTGRELPKDQIEALRTLSESLSTAHQLITQIEGKKGRGFWSGENTGLLKRISEHATALTTLLSERFSSKSR